VSAYDNDPRVKPDPIVGPDYWLVRSTWQLFNVAEDDDGLCYVFLLDESKQGRSARRLGDLVNIPPAPFDVVVHALIGDPQ
jgi:hypothetical protein